MFFLFTNFGFAQISSTPSPAISTGIVTINFNKAGTPLANDSSTFYAHIGLTVDGQRWQNVKGKWGVNTAQPALSLVSGSNYKLELSPDLYTYFGVPTTSSITEICLVIRNAAGNLQTTDTFLNVGAFQVNLTAPIQKG